MMERTTVYDILIVDDEPDIRELVAGILEDEGYETRQASNSDDALIAIEERRPYLVILDIWLQGSRLDGLEVLDRIQKMHPGSSCGDYLRAWQYRNCRDGHEAGSL